MEHKGLLPCNKRSFKSYFPNSAEFRSHPFDFFKTHFNIIPYTSGSSKQANSLMFTIANALRISCVRLWNRESLLRASRLWEELWSVKGTLRSQYVLPVSVECPLDDRNVAHTYPNLYVYVCICPRRQFQIITPKLLMCRTYVSVYFIDDISPVR
jgi:hypothetical protein